MKALQMLGKHPNVVELLFYVRHLDQIVLVFPFFTHEKFKHLLCHFTLEDMKKYMQQLLSAVAYVHSCGIAHRDVNPSNYLYSKELEKGKLIDFGLADFAKKPMQMRPSRSKSSRFYSKKCSHPATSVCKNCLSRRQKRVANCGTPGYKAPEVLLQYRYQTSAIDVWSCGVILLSLLSKKYPFFTSRHDSAALIEIIGVFGSSACVHAADQIGISLTISNNFKGVCIDTLCSKSTPEGERGSDLVPLVLALLDVNCLTRITAEQALCRCINLI